VLVEQAVRRLGSTASEPDVSVISATKAVARAGRRLKEHLHSHLFRHTYATRLHELGVDLPVIQGLLGHESVATTETYTRASAARERRAIQELVGGVHITFLG
jgi:integrase/recombinase XerD